MILHFRKSANSQVERLFHFFVYFDISFPFWIFISSAVIVSVRLVYYRLWLCVVKESTLGQLRSIERCFGRQRHKLICFVLRLYTKSLSQCLIRLRPDVLTGLLPWLLWLTFRVEIHLRIGFHGCWWSKSTIFSFKASLGTASLTYLFLVVFEWEEVWLDINVINIRSKTFFISAGIKRNIF